MASLPCNVGRRQSISRPERRIRSALQQQISYFPIADPRRHHERREAALGTHVHVCIIGQKQTDDIGASPPSYCIMQRCTATSALGQGVGLVLHKQLDEFCLWSSKPLQGNESP